MCHLRSSVMFGLPFRLFIAALTFFVGLAAGSLWGALRTSEAPSPTTTTVTTTSTVTATNGAGRVDYSRTFNAKNTVLAGILNGRAKSKPAPVYPPAAKSAGAEGTVVVNVTVDEEGRVEGAWGVSGHDLLLPAAVEAARAARFAPTRLEGRPVKVAGTLTYDFVLD